MVIDTFGYNDNRGLFTPEDFPYILNYKLQNQDYYKQQNC